MLRFAHRVCVFFHLVLLLKKAKPKILGGNVVWEEMGRNISGYFFIRLECLYFDVFFLLLKNNSSST